MPSFWSLFCAKGGARTNSKLQIPKRPTSYSCPIPKLGAWILVLGIYPQGKVSKTSLGMEASGLLVGFNL
jgi:hypothetical protein